METAIIIILGLYFIQHLLLFIGIIVNTKKPAGEPSEYPFVSVIIAARNEENNIAACIESLLRVDYPADKLEVLLVNDRSTDKTKEIMQSYSKDNSLLKH